MHRGHLGAQLLQSSVQIRSVYLALHFDKDIRTRHKHKPQWYIYVFNTLLRVVTFVVWQLCSQNVEKVTHIKGGLLDQHIKGILLD